MVLPKSLLEAGLAYSLYSLSTVTTPEIFYKIPSTESTTFIRHYTS